MTNTGEGRETVGEETNEHAEWTRALVKVWHDRGLWPLPRAVPARRTFPVAPAILRLATYRRRG